MNDEAPLILRKKKPSSKDIKSSSALNAALARDSATNKNHNPTVNLGKIDAETEIKKLNVINPDVAKTIQQTRQRLGMTQKDLAYKINEKIQLVNEYESGKAAAPNQSILSKMEKALGVKLRGSASSIGTPLPS